jgi:hypothetical protein
MVVYSDLAYYIDKFLLLLKEEYPERMRRGEVVDYYLINLMNLREAS